MKNKIILVSALICFVLSIAGVAVASPNDTSTFVIFMGDQEIGSEEFTYNAEGLTTKGTLSVAGQTVVTESVLTGQMGNWNSYEFKTSGVMLSGSFTDDGLKLVVGPIEQTHQISDAYAILDNNIFGQYQQLIDMAENADGLVEFDVVTSVLMLMGQSPILSGTVERKDAVDYDLNGNVVTLQEYEAILEGDLYVKILGDLDGRMVLMEIPAQAAKAVREDYVGLQSLSGQGTTAQTTRDEEFNVASGDITLVGTLSFPLEGDGPFPVVLLNSGSGPQDRNGNTPPAMMTYMFRTMAERFAERGIAVLRYDERGVGQSTGDYDQANFSDLVGDVQALVGYLKEHKMVDADRIAILGHSEGGYIAPLIAAQDPQIAGVVILAGPSTPLDEIMVEQLDHQAKLPYLTDAQRQMMEELIPQMNQLLQDAKDGKTESVVEMNLDWIREHMAHDPIATIQQVKAPVLILHGEEDIKVLPYHADGLAGALRAAGNENVEVSFLPKTTHEFILFPIDNPDYDPTDPWKVNPDVFELTGRWLEANLK